MKLRGLFIHAYSVNTGIPKSNAVHQVMPRIKVKIMDHELKLQLPLASVFVHRTALRLRTALRGELLRNAICCAGVSLAESHPRAPAVSISTLNRRLKM